ncbi:MAG: tetratricopeptide repeat protein [Burkholderiales bacterium]|nr:tetratricopeptide repeat protein [Burkholderiales bacterium]
MHVRARLPATALRPGACALLPLLLLLLLLLVAGGAQAQVLDEVELGGAGGEVELTMRFAATVRYQRHVVTPSGNAIQLFFAITGGGAAAQRGVLETTRRYPRTDESPEITVRLLAPLGNAASRRIDITFGAPIDVVRVGPGADNRTLIAVIRASMQDVSPPPSAPSPPAVPLPPAPAGATGEGSGLAQARAALEAQRYEEAVGLLNQLLNQPPNADSQAAQELIGYSREGLGEVDRARAEYQLYLKLYPEGEGAERVKQRVAGLSVPKIAAAGDAAERAGRYSTWGSVSTFYYGGNSRVRTDSVVVTPATNATTIDSQTLTSVDQSSLVASVDANARYQSGNWDNRVVFRDVGSLSLLSDQSSENRLTALFTDVRYQPQQLAARLGRQTSTSGGVLGRFDGGALSWGFAPSWRAGVLAGTPSDPVLGERKQFVGATLDADDLVDGLGAGLFAIQQRTEGMLDRRAVGGELRYFTPKLTVFSLLDYDVEYGVLNVGSTQGSWQFGTGGTLNFLYDYRRTPTLQLSNALLGEATQSLRELLDNMSREVLEQQARDLTPVSRVLLVGGTYPVSKHWQLGAEVRQSSLTGTGATATLPATEGTGDVLAFTLQAIGTGIFTDTGVLTLTASELVSDAYDAILLAANSRFIVGGRWTVEPSLRFYRQVSATDTTLQRLTPTIRVIYQLRDRLSFESEFTLERSTVDSELLDETNDLVFYYLGLRYDF